MTIGEFARALFANGQEDPNLDAFTRKIDELVAEVKGEFWQRGFETGQRSREQDHQGDILQAYEEGQTHGFRECLLPKCTICEVNKKRRELLESKEKSL